MKKAEFEKISDKAAEKYVFQSHTPHTKREKPAWFYSLYDFRSGARWAREFTVREICEWLKTNFETTDKSAANWYAQKIEQHFKDRGGE